VTTKYLILTAILDQIAAEAPQQYKRYHPIKSDQEKVDFARARAFIHLYLKVQFGLLDFAVRENLVADDTGDGGIDAYYIDDSNKHIYFIQSKFRTTARNFGLSSL
jgi:hypothetical protein